MKEVMMDDLSMHLRQLCLRGKSGSYGTRKNRQRGLDAMAKDLKQLGYNLPTARSLKPKHVHALVEHWQSKDLDAVTMKNRLAWMRWWAEQVNKQSVVPKTNKELGIRDTKVPLNRAMTVDTAQLNRVSDVNIKGALLLQQAFGLRREEAIKFRPSYADQKSFIRLKSSWTKGGKARTIPIVTKHQRDVLALVTQIARGGALIPVGKTFAYQLKYYERQTLIAGLRNTHGLRYTYAQKRYHQLTGFACPHKGGMRWKEMSRVQREEDRKARYQISRELGHYRLCITDTYLGSAMHE